MTQYKNKVIEHLERMEAEEWGKKIKYVLADDGIIKYAYNNGEIHIEENKPDGKKWIEGKAMEKETLLEKFSKFVTDHTRGH